MSKLLHNKVSGPHEDHSGHTHNDSSILEALDGIACGCCDHDEDVKSSNTVPKAVVQVKEIQNKLKSPEQTLSVLDDIACGCGCEETESSSETFDLLDDVGCNCESCEDSQLGHDHKEVTEETSLPVLVFIKKHMEMTVAFILFFTALFTKFEEIIDLSMYLVAYALVGRKVIKSAIKSVTKGRMLDENFLMAIASIVAFAIGEYAEGVAVMLFYAVGQLTEEYAINRSKKSITSLLDLRPDFANIKTSFGLKEVRPSDLKIGDVVLVKPGERIPIDGEIILGESTIDSAMLTGESLPVNARIGSEVFSGTINISAVIEVLVTREFKDSAVSKILSMVQKANENKAVTEKFITKFAKIYTPLVVLGAALIAVVPPLLFAQSFDTWLYRGAIFLVVSCPCALVISVPLGYFGGLGGAARKGILVKGGQYLEALKHVKTIVFDKTGTLTKGNFSVTEIEVLGDLNENEILRISASVEHFSTHPIAKAIVKAYKGVLDSSVSDLVELPGKGLKARLDQKNILIGNDALMIDHHIDVPENTSLGSTLYLAIEKNIVGVIHINDEIKEDTKEGLEQLRALGVENFIMLTGDRSYIAESIGQTLGLTEIHSQLLPEDKLNRLELIIDKHGKVIFVGDGINDAPVLARADVGIAMGNLGSDVAIESSDVVLMTDEITSVADGIKVARFTSKIIWQNIILALGVKIIIMILGTLGLASLWMAIFGDVGVAFIAILNSGRAIYNK